MRTFRGKLTAAGSAHEIDATISIDRDWIRIWSGVKRIGAWNRDQVRCERVTVFRFTLELDGDIHTFVPDDPAGFADGIGVVVDLRPTSRFGLGERVRAAKEAMAAARAAADEDSAG